MNQKSFYCDKRGTCVFWGVNLPEVTLDMLSSPEFTPVNLEWFMMYTQMKIFWIGKRLMDGVWFFIDKEYNQNFHWKLEKAKGYLYFAYRLIHQITYVHVHVQGWHVEYCAETNTKAWAIMIRISFHRKNRVYKDPWLVMHTKTRRRRKQSAPARTDEHPTCLYIL